MVELSNDSNLIITLRVGVAGLITWARLLDFWFSISWSKSSGMRNISLTCSIIKAKAAVNVVISSGTTLKHDEDFCKFRTKHCSLSIQKSQIVFLVEIRANIQSDCFRCKLNGFQLRFQFQYWNDNLFVTELPDEETSLVTPIYEVNSTFWRICKKCLRFLQILQNLECTDAKFLLIV